MADFGRRLKEAREQRGVSLRQIATTTKISMAALEALERSDFSRLPGGIFSRAFVRAYAVHVGLDPEQTVQDFLIEYEQNDNAAAEKAPPEVTADDRAFLERQRRAALWLRGGSVVLLLGVAAGVVAWQVRSHTRAANDRSVDVAGSRPASMPVVAPPAAAQIPPPVAAPPDAPAAVTPAASSPAASALAAAAPATSGASAPPANAAAPKDDELAVRLEAKADCWTRVTVDGVQVFEQTLRTGETRDIKPGRDVYIQVGNAGGLSWSINGQPARPIGRIGQTAAVHVTRATLDKFVQ